MIPFLKKYRLYLAVLLMLALVWSAYSINMRMSCRFYIKNNDLAGLQRIVHQRKWLATAMLSVAYSEENREAFEVLLKADANPDGIRYGRLTLLHTAAQNTDSFWIEKLLQFHADPNYHKSTRNIHPLMSAIEGNCPENVRLLIKAGANLDTPTSRNMSMLTFAWSQRRGEIAMILLEAGALVNPPSFRSESFVSYFQRMSEDGIVLNEREKIDEEFLKKARQWLRDENLDLWNATWDKSQGDFGVWTIPPMPEQEPEL